MLDRHTGESAALFRRVYAALEQEFGPFSADLLRLEASRAAAHYVHLVGSSRDRGNARRQRDEGKGRRISLARLSSLGRRLGLDDQAYDTARERLRELARSNGHDGLDLAQRVAQAHAAAAQARQAGAPEPSVDG